MSERSWWRVGHLRWRVSHAERKVRKFWAGVKAAFNAYAKCGIHAYVPFELSLLLAQKPEALSAVGKIFIDEIFRWQRSLGLRMGLCSTAAAPERLRGGAICFPQRFGGSLNLNVHYHVIVPDALFYREASRNLIMEVLRRPNRAELEDINFNTAQRCLRWLRKNDYLESEAPAADPKLMEVCLNSSVGLGNLAALSHKGETQRVTPDKPGTASHKVKGGQFNIHVGDPAHGKEEREHIPSFATVLARR